MADNNNSSYWEVRGLDFCAAGAFVFCGPETLQSCVLLLIEKVGRVTASRDYINISSYPDAGPPGGLTKHTKRKRGERCQGLRIDKRYFGRQKNTYSR